MATQPKAEDVDLEDAVTTGADAEAGKAEGGNDNDGQGGERDFEAEARQHGWTPEDEFKGDPKKWVDAETFVKRADEVMPFLKKQNAALKREIEDTKRQMKKAREFFTDAEERAYKRALTDLEKRHDEAVAKGDVNASKVIRKEMAELKPLEKDAAPDPDQARREFAEWVEENDWYVTDKDRRDYADLQAQILGPAHEYDGGPQAYLEEIKARTTRKFATKKLSPVGNGGNAPAPKKGGKSFNDLPPEAKRLADKWVASGIIKSRDDYVKNYDWS